MNAQRPRLPPSDYIMMKGQGWGWGGEARAALAERNFIDQVPCQDGVRRKHRPIMEAFKAWLFCFFLIM